MNKVQLNSLVKPLVEIYDEIELEIIKDILKRLPNYDDTGGSIDWLLDKLEDLGSLNKDTLNLLKGNKKEVAKELKKMLKAAPNSHKEYLNILNKYYERGLLNRNPLNIYNSTSINSLINEAIKDTTDIIDLIDTKVIEGTKESYKKILNKAYIETSSGIYTYQESIRKALKELADEGISIIHYENGRSMGIESVVRRDVITRVNKLVGDTTIENAKSLGTNLLYVDQHLGARVRTKYMKNDYEAHAEWQGKVYMIEGSSDKYDNFYEKTGYGEMLGLKGINCYHDFRPHFEWEKIPDRYDEEENAKVYEQFQKQREYEREIRKLKREKLVSEGFYSEDEKKVLNERFKTVNKEYDTFLKENGLRKDYSREYVNNNSEKDETMLSELYNTEANREQFERYNKVLGDKAPDNIEEFLKIKYNNPDTWNLLKEKYRLKGGYLKEVEKGNIPVLLDFDYFYETYSKLKNELIGIKVNDEIIVKSVSPHYVSRTLGSEEPGHIRKPVSIEMSKKTLLNPDKVGVSKTTGRTRIIGEAEITIENGRLIQTNVNERKKYHENARRK